MMIEEGFGMAFTFDHLVSTGENSSLCFRPLEPKIEADIFLIWKKYQMFTRAASIFLEEVRRKSR